VLPIVDDRCGRAEAHRLQLPLIGTAAVLLLALEAGLIEACGPLLQALRQQGYLISDGLMQAVLDQAGEA
jgi:predicted nucleic acid-binding protein